MILTIRTDKPEAEIGLFFKTGQERQYDRWQAHRELSSSIHTKIQDLLKKEGKDWGDITGVVYFKGPGSFTGLRIGLTVANSLAYGLDIPIIGASGDNWKAKGIAKLADNKNELIGKIKYGQPPNITKQKH